MLNLSKGPNKVLNLGGSWYRILGTYIATIWAGAYYSIVKVERNGKNGPITWCNW